MNILKGNVKNQYCLEASILKDILQKNKYLVYFGIHVKSKSYRTSCQILS